MDNYNLSTKYTGNEFCYRFPFPITYGSAIHNIIWLQSNVFLCMQLINSFILPILYFIWGVIYYVSNNRCLNSILYNYEIHFLEYVLDRPFKL